MTAGTAQRPTIGTGIPGRALSPRAEAERLGILLGALTEEAAPSRKIIPLFADTETGDADPAPIDWAAAIQLIRDVGARVRRARDFAQEVARQSHTLIQRSLAQTEEAEGRAQAAEAAAATAILRAERAEEQALRAEERIRAAEAQAEAAKAGETEAQLWLRRLHASLQNEFDDLIVDQD